MKNENKLWKLLAPIVVLSVIALVITGALALTNQATAPVIAAAEQAKADAAMQVVLPDGAEFQTIQDMTGLPETMTAAAKAGNDAGYVFTVNGKGFDKGLVVMVGLDAKGAIVGVQVLSSNETAGIGSKVVADGSEFLVQLPGMTDTAGIQATSGATMTSNGIKNAIQNAFDAYVVLTGGSVEVKVPAKPQNLTDEVLEQYFPGASFTEVPGGLVSDAGTVVYAAVPGMMGDVPVAVFFGADDAILGIVADVSGETPDIGSLCGESAFTSLFAGVSSADEVDAISGSTVTSDAVKGGVNQAIANLNTVKGAA